MTDDAAGADELDTELGLILADLEKRELGVFPNVPFRDDPAALSVAWPSTDWRAFLDLAASVGVELVYVGAFGLSPEDLQRTRDRLTGTDDDGGAGDHNAALLELQRRVGQVSSLELGFTHGGVLHVCELVADWWQQVRQEEEVQQFRRNVDLSERTREQEAGRRHRERNQEAWARAIAASPAFLAATNEDARRRAAAASNTEIAALLSSDRSLPDWQQGYSFALAVVRWADQIARHELRPQRVEAAAARLDDLAGRLRGTGPWAAARTRAERRRLARQLLAGDLGFPPPADLVTRLEDQTRTRA